MPPLISRPEVKLDPATPAIVAALDEDPFYRAIAGGCVDDDSCRRDILTKYFDFSIEEGHRLGRCVHLADPAIGVAVWILPQNPEARTSAAMKKRTFLESTLDASGFAAYYAMVEFMSRKSASIVDDRTWYLSIVGIDPARQGQGFGRKLLEPTLAEIDELRVNSYLETFTPPSERFYERLGFSVKERFTEPATGAEYALMMRPADAAGR